MGVHAALGQTGCPRRVREQREIVGTRRVRARLLPGGVLQERFFGLSSFAAKPKIAARAGSYIVPTAYRGAVDPAGTRWYEGWTVYYRN